MEIKFKGYNAVHSAQVAVDALAWICLLVGVIFLIMAIALDGPVPAAIVVIVSSIPLFITKAVLKGFKFVVYASEKYIDNEYKKSTAEEK